LIVLALCAAVVLAIGASFVARGLAGSGSITVTHAHPAPGTVLRQDYQGATVQSGAAIKHKSGVDMPGFRD